MDETRRSVQTQIESMPKTIEERISFETKWKIFLEKQFQNFASFRQIDEFQRRLGVDVTVNERGILSAERRTTMEFATTRCTRISTGETNSFRKNLLEAKDEEKSDRSENTFRR